MTNNSHTCKDCGHIFYDSDRGCEVCADTNLELFEECLDELKDIELTGDEQEILEMECLTDEIRKKVIDNIYKKAGVK